jgi:putative pyruvate formate lyase activating enzyme
MKSMAHLLEHCRVCPNSCGVDRLRGERGRCRIGGEIVVASSGLHMGEERELVGSGGSGTIFLSGCSLSCVFCQNSAISQSAGGRVMSIDEAARLMLSLEAQGAENVNLVTPTHQGPLLFEAVQLARSRGLQIPVVYNSSGYESLDFLREIDGLVEIYMPDMKYGDSMMAEKYSGITEYAERSREALLEMQRQVGTLRLDERGVATRGLLVRHLVLPDGIAGSRAVVDFLVDHICPRTALNVMAQYSPSGGLLHRPAHRAAEFPALRRRPSFAEVDAVKAYARQRGMTNLLA